MKKLLLALSVIAVTGSAVAADFSPYVSLKAGAGGSSWSESDVSPTGFVLAGAVGVQYSALQAVNFRGEFEISMMKFEDSVAEDDVPYYTSSMELKQNFSMYLANFYVDFLKEYKVKPYVGFGFGMASLKEEIKDSLYVFALDENFYFNETAKWNSFTYGLNAGLGINITKGLAADLGARYMIVKIEDTNVNIFTGTLGLRYTF